MCTLVLLRRPGHAWPLLIAANRDEMRDRPWRAPARHWPDRPRSLPVSTSSPAAPGSASTTMGWSRRSSIGATRSAGAGRAIPRRAGPRGPRSRRRRRGRRGAGRARRWAYRSFNLVVADDRAAFWLRVAGHGRAAATCTAAEIPAGLSMLTAYDLDDPADPADRAPPAALARGTAARRREPAIGATGRRCSAAATVTASRAGR